MVSPLGVRSGWRQWWTGALCALGLAGIAKAQSADELIRQGDDCLEKHDSKGALGFYQRADELEPRKEEILRRISRAYSDLMGAETASAEKKELGTKALEAAQAAVAADPRNAQAHLCVAIVYGQLALLESPRRQVEYSALIKQEAETATALDPRLEYAWYVLGRWNYEMAALNPFLKAVAQAIYGRFPDASYEKAVVCFQKAAALNPRRAIHFIELGRACAALGKNLEARAAIRKGLALPAVDQEGREAQARGRKTLAQLPPSSGS